MAETSPVSRVAEALRAYPSATSPQSDTTGSPQAMATREVPTGLRAAEESEDDMALEYDSMVLLSQLEQFSIRLTDTMMRASQALALEYLVQVVNCIVDFTEKLAIAQARHYTLNALLTCGRTHYVCLGLGHVRDGRLSMAIFEQLHLRRGAVIPPATFEHLSQDLMRIINICLNVCVKAFHAPGFQQQWRTVYTGFFVNLVHALQRLQTTPAPEAS